MTREYVPEHHDPETYPYVVRRVGWRYQIYLVYPPDSESRCLVETCRVRFWRWISAARVAKELSHAGFVGSLKVWREEERR